MGRRCRSTWRARPQNSDDGGDSRDDGNNHGDYRKPDNAALETEISARGSEFSVCAQDFTQICL
jgi:hypothetical protein